MTVACVSRRTQLGSALAILSAFAAVAAGGVTYWQHDPATPGDWFDPANWTAGVPSPVTYDKAYIENGGTAQVSADDAESYRLHVGYTGAGRVVQTGGLVRPGILYLGHEVGSEGRYEMSGGSMLFDRAYVGRYGSGTFIHSGGRIGYTDDWMTLAYGLDSTGTYELSGTGEVYLQGITIGSGGAGVFRQSGGAVGLTGPLTVGATGSYELHGGGLVAGELLVGASWCGGRFLQSGGTNHAGYMEIGLNSCYELSGGQLWLTQAGGQIFGELDLANSSAELHLYGGILNCGAGTIRNAASAAFIGQANSLFVCPAGFDPQTDFGSFVTDGVVLQAGGSAVIPAGRTILGQGVLPGHLEIHGTLEYSGGSIAITGGLAVADGGIANLGRAIINAALVVANEISGLGNGEISVNEMWVGKTGTGSFVQTAGELRSSSLYLGTGAGSDGTYEMSGGTLYARRVVVGSGSRGHFRQTGGYAGYAGGYHLMIGEGTGSEGLYELSGSAELFADLERVGDRGTGVFVQTGGTHTVEGYLHIGNEAGSDGTYEMSGGVLVTPYLDVGIDGTGRLIQSGGSITVKNPVTVSSLSTYRVSGGTLEAEGLTVDGTLAVTAQGGHFQLSRFLSFDQTARFTAAPGAAIYVVSGAFGHESTDPGAMAGLSNLTLVLEEYDGRLCLVEPAGADLGTDPLGWTDNFALGTVQVGEADSGSICLRDDHDNQNDGPDNEALYVDWLVLNPGAKIEFNDLNLYFLNGGSPKQLFHGDANLDGCVDGLDYVAWAGHYEMTGMAWCDGDFTGDGVVDGLDYIVWSNNYLQGYPASPGAVPEPSAAVLLVAGLWGLSRRRRCQKRR